MNSPKYSVVLPTLNGAATLAVTLPEMVKIDRDDVEWVISNNCSDDNTKEVVSSFSDPRLRLAEPPERLPVGEHLEFAYLQARGEWQGHLGDDDILFPSRFEVLDEVIARSHALAIRGEFVRYHWPDYPNHELANVLDGRTFDGAICEIAGRELAAKSLNEKPVYGGGSWVVHRSVVEKVRSRCGFFSSPQHVEFFAMRAACALSPSVVTVGVPIWVIGRHSKSVGTQAFHPRGETASRDWDWSFEDPDPWRYCPFQYKGYATLSLDAALAVRAMLPEILGNVKIDWSYWSRRVWNCLEGLIKNEQLPHEAPRLFDEGLKKLPRLVRLQWWLHEHARVKLVAKGLYRLVGPSGRIVGHREAASTYPDCFGWPHALHGERVGIHSIVDVPNWVERTFCGFFP